MKQRTRLFAAALGTILTVGCAAMAACGGGNGDGEDYKLQEGGEHYNIVFTLATIPPVLAALDSIQSGYPTYAMIERGNTYSGIEKTEGLEFYNIGFDTSSNTSAGFSEEAFTKTTDKIKELSVNGNEVFHIYLRDADPMFGYALAANAGLKRNQYELVLCEDGSASYESFKKTYVEGKTVTENADGPYETYRRNVEDMKRKRESVLSKNNNKITNLPQGWEYGLAASALENVVWRLQDVDQLYAELETLGSTKLLSAMGAEGHDESTEYSSEIESETISYRVNHLSEEKRTAYLSLMYGSYYQDTYAALTRTQLEDGTKVPAKKLIFIGSRIKGSPTVASGDSFGIGGAKTAADVPNSYAELADKYKTPLLFGTEADYRLFLNAIQSDANYEGSPTAAQKDAVRVQCFNYYIDYMFTMKFTHAMYGEGYDVIVKGHPSEVLGKHSTWTNPYVAEDYNYDLLMDNLVIKFHASDSVGKFIGMVPYGTAAENLAYLGADIAIGGLDSSTYKGYDQSVDVKFLMVLADTDITENTNVGDRFKAGTLFDHNADGSASVTAYYNNGSLLKVLSVYYGDLKDTARKAQYDGLLSAWLAAHDATDVDMQGRIS